MSEGMEERRNELHTHDSLYDCAKIMDHFSLVTEQEVPYLGPRVLAILSKEWRGRLPSTDRNDVVEAFESLLFV